MCLRYRSRDRPNDRFDKQSIVELVGGIAQEVVADGSKDNPWHPGTTSTVELALEPDDAARSAHAVKLGMLVVINVLEKIWKRANIQHMAVLLHMQLSLKKHQQQYQIALLESA